MSGRVVVSGLGLVSPLGLGVARFWDGLRAGRSALRPARRFGADAYRGEPVGEVPGLDPLGLPRKTAYTEAAVAEALGAARLPALPDGSLVILVGQAPLPSGPAGAGAPEELDAERRELLGPGATGPLAGADAVHLSHACASAAFGVALARTALAAGAVPLAVVAGASVLNRYEYASMEVVKAVGREPARPFDTGRAGISLGEGGGAVVLEHARSARGRGLRADLTVAGASCRVAAAKAAASDLGVVTDCLRAAVAEAGAERLDHVHAHATGTVQGDAAELAAIAAVAAELGVPPVPVSSHKGAIGHLLHVSGVPALAAAALALRTGTVPPTAGLTDPEPVAGVRLPTRELAAPGMRVAAVNSFGFGGSNASLVLRLE